MQVVKEHLERLLKQASRQAIRIELVQRPCDWPPPRRRSTRPPSPLPPPLCYALARLQVDMDKETQRSIFQKLSAELGVSLEEHKSLIKVKAPGALAAPCCCPAPQLHSRSLPTPRCSHPTPPCVVPPVGD